MAATDLNARANAVLLERVERLDLRSGPIPEAEVVAANLMRPLLLQLSEWMEAGPHTLILFESPHRIAKLLADAHEVLGDREACVCVDLTKRYEATHRGVLSALIGEFEGETVRGEVTVVIAGTTRR